MTGNRPGWSGMTNTPGTRPETGLENEKSKVRTPLPCPIPDSSAPCGCPGLTRNRLVSSSKVAGCPKAESANARSARTIFIKNHSHSWHRAEKRRGVYVTRPGPGLWARGAGRHVVQEQSILGAQSGWACPFCADPIDLRPVGVVRADRVSFRSVSDISSGLAPLDSDPGVDSNSLSGQHPQNESALAHCACQLPDGRPSPRQRRNRSTL